MKYWISAALLIAALPVPAMAQDYGSDQAAATELRNAIQRLARRPTDSDALLDAGNAALMLRDYDSALGFFTRAEALQPSSGRV
ncbi:MAG: SPOR domain-containing protein, partial [Novosphingopyxis baekryungensis]|nr:SPOR domain-containing protein [Novosphingopyxis baekryungensis]